MPRRYTLAQLTAFANRSTFHRRRAEAMGWTFDNLEVLESPNDFGVLQRGDFTCVCGTKERFARFVDDFFLEDAPARLVEEEFDIAHQLYKFGSFSRKHLEKDGFDPEFIDRVLKIEQEYRG